MSSKVTVLTCVYNGLPYLKEAIESTLNQSYKNFEYLIIDDCSPDKEVVKLIQSYKDLRIRFIRNEKNLGVSGTFNKALSLINTQYVIRLDQDDVSLHTRIEDQIDFLEENPDISVICSWEHTIDLNGRKMKDCKRSLKNYGEFLGYILLGLCPIWHPSIAFRTSAIVEAGGFKVEYTRAEDFEVTTRMALKRYGAAVVPRFHLLQRQHDASQSTQFNNKQAVVTERIHVEALKYFSDNSEIEKLGRFLRLEAPLKDDKFNQKYLKKIYIILEGLYRDVTLKQKLTSDEFESLKSLIDRRVGLGFRLSPFLVRLPSVLFYPSYYVLSPLQVRRVRKVVSKFYHNVLCLRYTFK